MSNGGLDDGQIWTDETKPGGRKSTGGRKSKCEGRKNNMAAEDAAAEGAATEDAATEGVATEDAAAEKAGFFGLACHRPRTAKYPYIIINQIVILKHSRISDGKPPCSTLGFTISKSGVNSHNKLYIRSLYSQITKLWMASPCEKARN